MPQPGACLRAGQRALAGFSDQVHEFSGAIFFILMG
jgi:hypothetical protein